MISFSKFHGNGNDFILIDDRESSFPVNSEMISHLCNRRFAIGADGLILLQPSPIADGKMRIFNSDGKEASLCGNALFSLLSFFSSLGFPNGRCTIECQYQVIEGIIGEERSEIFLPLPSSFSRVQIEKFSSFLVHTGVDHLVLFVDHLSSLDVAKKGAYLRFHSLLSPKGANINFVQRKGNHLSIRTYERGVEAETLSCGTGAAAAAFVAHSLWPSKSSYEVDFPGGRMETEIRKKDIAIKSQAKAVFHGKISLTELKKKSCFSSSF